MAIWILRMVATYVDFNVQKVVSSVLNRDA